MERRILFSEKQRFTQWWLWIIFIGIIGTTSYGICSQLILGKPFGNNPASDAGLLISLAFVLLLLVLMRSITLTTRITDEGIACKLFPFHLSFCVYKWTDIAHCYVRKYKPIMEFGGWGIKYGASGLAYNISGNIGIQIELKNGRRILIGTQQGEEAERVIELINKQKDQDNDKENSH